MKKTLIFVLLMALTAMPSTQAQTYLDPTAPLEQRVEDALSRMTTHEKIKVLHAQSKFTSAGVPRLGIRQLNMDDGPHGVREELEWNTWNPAGWTNDYIVAFPSLTCLAATWNRDLSALYGNAVSEEFAFRGKDVMLGPGVNIQRTPLNGRAFEYMGEDPMLAAEMVVPYIQAAQQNGELPDAATIAPQMYPAWNLGNTMEGGNNANNFTNKGGLGGETSWQSTKTTQELIDFVAAQGFKAVRIPCSWVMGHITDEANVTIDADWLSRVKEVVDYCIKDGLYVLLNDHWDGGWLEASFRDVSDAKVSANSEILRKLWTQIATAFRDYDEHLLFGGLNEPGMQNNDFNAAMTTALIAYEQVFIDAVRTTGGNNASRTLVVQGPKTNIDQTCNLFDVTRLTDTTTGRLMVEVHFYDPWLFTGQEEDASWGSMYWFWGAANHAKGASTNAWVKRNTPTNYEESFVKSQMQKLKTKFADKGYPVIIGEYGCLWRDVSNASYQKLHNQSVQLYHKTVVQAAIENGCIPFAWDTNYCSQNGTKGSFIIFDRANRKVFCQYAVDGIKEGVASASCWGGSTSGIHAIPFDRANADAPAYNLAGQRVAPDTKGLIIIGRQKIFNRK